MRIGYAEQYGTPSVIIEMGDNPDDVIEFADMEGATVSSEDDGEDRDYVVRLPGRPDEVYTEAALRRSIPKH